MAKNHVIKADRQCEDCSGTGLYIGMAEKDGAAVVCHSCSGEGHYKFDFRYTEWEKGDLLKKRKNVKRVFATSSGVGIGVGKNKKTGELFDLEDFGGLSYEDWLNLKNKKEFPKGTEMRKFTCPAWWWQNTDYEKKPEWDECRIMGSFSSCPYFGNKEECWKKYDKVGKKNQK